jgi:hypothetical protein
MPPSAVRPARQPSGFIHAAIFLQHPHRHELILDPEGEELRDPDQAWNVARTTIREILKTEGEQAGLLRAILEVTDDEGEIVLEFPFTEAILDGSEDSETRH